MKNFFFGEGNLGHDPILKYVPVKGSQKAVLEFYVRISYDKQNTETGEYEDNGGFWASVSYWGKRAEAANKILKSGMRVFVIGEISQDDYVASKGEREGQVVTATNVTASHVGLSLLGIDTVTVTARKNKALSTLENAHSVDDPTVSNVQVESEYYAQKSGR